MPASYDQDYYYQPYYGMRTYYMIRDSWESLNKPGALFFKWIPTNVVRPEIGDSVDVLTFSSLAADGYNKVNDNVMLKDALQLGLSTAVAMLTVLSIV